MGIYRLIIAVGRLFKELRFHPRLLFLAVTGILALISFGWWMSIPRLSRAAPDTYRWAPRTLGYEIKNQCTIYFDNGTEKTIIVSIDNQGQFDVPAQQMIKLEEPAGEIVFAVSGEAVPIKQGAAIVGDKESSLRVSPVQSIADGKFYVKLDPLRMYVYNPGALFTYEVRFHHYGDTDRSAKPMEPIIISQTTFFEAEGIDYPFQDPPEYAVIHLGETSSTRTSLTHLRRPQ